MIEVLLLLLLRSMVPWYCRYRNSNYQSKDIAHVQKDLAQRMARKVRQRTCMGAGRPPSASCWSCWLCVCVWGGVHAGACLISLSSPTHTHCRTPLAQAATARDPLCRLFARLTLGGLPRGGGNGDDIR